jgi:hypothetical protein
VAFILVSFLLDYPVFYREDFVLSRIFFLWEKNLSQRDTNRKIRPFEWGLEFLGDPSMQGDSKRHLMEYARKAVAESDAYHSYEAVKDWHLDGNHLTFTSSLPTIYPKNNTVHGWHFPADSNGRVVLVLPQWNADGQSHMALCRMLNYYGLSAMRLSLPYHDLRMPEELERADYMLSPNLGRTLQSILQAVIDCRAALDWLQCQGYTKFAILGTSIGSCVALITLAHDSRLELGVMNHVSPYFADVVWNGISTRHVHKVLDGNIELEDLREIWMPISPRAYFKKLAGTGKKSFLVHALFDFTFPTNLSKVVLQDYRYLNLPHSAFALYCGHYTSGVFPFNIVLGNAMCGYIRRNL